MARLTACQFWRLYAHRRIRLARCKDIPWKLLHSLRFDQLFGRLARHHVEAGLECVQEIRCENCRFALVEASEVCDAHMGIIQGVLENELSRKLVISRQVEKSTCYLRLSADGDSS